jgi:diguanylate cyclase (GGDEF)-like protein/PAS domain S-box-containing protein
MNLRPWRLKGWHLTAVTLTVAAAFCGLVTEALLEARRDTWDRASQSGRNLARAMATEIERTVESLDLSLKGAADNSQVLGVMSLEPQLRNMVLFDRAAAAKNLGYMVLLDARGDIVASSRLDGPLQGNFADRGYFRAHRDNAALGLHVSEPFRSGLSSDASLAFSRRVPAPDGGFGGVAVGAVRLNSVRERFEAMDLGAKGSLTLFHEDGTIVMRVPYRDAFIGSDVSATEVYRRAMQSESGQFVAVSNFDGERQMHSFASVAGAPLRVAVSFSINDIEAGWRQHAILVSLAALVLVSVLLLASLALGRTMRKRQEAEAATYESEANFRLLAENCADMVTRIGPDGLRRYVSPASFRILGRVPEELVGRRPRDEIHANDAAAVAAASDRLQQSDDDTEATLCYRSRRADGTWIWMESTVRAVRDPLTGKKDGLVVVSRDVTERKRVEVELARLATLDGLTGIANRRSLDDALGREWRRCARAELPLSVLLVDVDRFKAMNDSQGHQKGDECLRLVGAVLGGTVRRASDLSARYGGEEFALLLPETDAMGAAAVAERVRAEVEALALPHEASGLPGGVVTVSVGGATIWPVPGEEATGPAALIGMADQCLYEAKRTGRNRAVHTAMPCPGLAASLGRAAPSASNFIVPT